MIIFIKPIGFVLCIFISRLGRHSSSTNQSILLAHFYVAFIHFSSLVVCHLLILTVRPKYVAFTWVGPSVSALKKGQAGPQRDKLKKVFHGLALELQIDDADDFTQENVARRLLARSDFFFSVTLIFVVTAFRMNDVGAGRLVDVSWMFVFNDCIGMLSMAWND
jgi:hypothetical protein